MHRLVIIITFLFFCLTVFGQGKTYVLLTGVSNYDDEDLNLSQSTKDAKMMKRILETQTSNIILLTSKFANRENVLEKFKLICSRAQPDDLVIFYYSGHGTDGYLITYGGFLSFNELIETSAECKAKKVFLLDACHAGSIDDPKDNIFLVACRAEEQARENNMIGAGYFTKALQKGIRGASDTNRDRSITLMELFKYVYTDVVRRSSSRQHPQMKVPKDFQDFVIAQWKQKETIHSNDSIE